MRNTKFNWLCIHCGARNIEVMQFQFDIPQSYVAVFTCKKCGKQTKISIILGIDLPEKVEEQ